MSNCFHCGDSISGKALYTDQQAFCCQGCISVYHILKQHDMQAFYDFEKGAGIKPKLFSEKQFDFLDVPEIRAKYIEFENDKIARTTLYLPTIHCSSCIYLLENIHLLNENINHSSIHFGKKEASFTFDPQAMQLSELASLLTRLGYQPNFAQKQRGAAPDKTFLYKIGIAGFAFGSIMLWSFPEYLGIERDNPEFRTYTSYLSFAVSIPVLLYSARDYFISAFKALQFRRLNLDVPIAIGIVALYAQSLWSIFNDGGPGYIDSFAGFIFFLLIGKWFQQKTYKSLSFERDYTAYFPVAILKCDENGEHIVEIEQLQVSDRIRLRNEEILPCDSVLLAKEARFDFSFVTGESELVLKKQGDFIYAGGKLSGPSVELEVKHESNRSHLTNLWNGQANKHKERHNSKYQDAISLYFLVAVLSIALVAGLFWFFIDASQTTRIVVSILIVTCPCALALSSPFTLGNIMRLLGRHSLYLKNAFVIESINETTDIVFDKTGTLSSLQQSVIFQGEKSLTQAEKAMVWTVVAESMHPLSVGIQRQLNDYQLNEDYVLQDLEEVPGMGIQATVIDQKGTSYQVKLGSASFVGAASSGNPEVQSHLLINGQYMGKFVFRTAFRDGLKDMLAQLKNYQLHVLTGDHHKDEASLKDLFPPDASFHFEQSPTDKLNYIQNLQLQNKKVLMIGDGLNDSGALQAANVGFAVSEDSFRFTPASDAILDSKKLEKLPELLRISKAAKRILRLCLIFSLSYNIVGLYFAVTGQLTPLVAAILMPISSVTVVAITTFSVWTKKVN